MKTGVKQMKKEYKKVDIDEIEVINYYRFFIYNKLHRIRMITTSADILFHFGHSIRYKYCKNLNITVLSMSA